MSVVNVNGVHKAYGDTVALAGLDLRVERGQVLGLLGPNGAGKTTIVSILSTLLKADSGVAQVSGFDVRTDPAQVRARIGLTGQYASVDEVLTGRENLVLVGRLARLTKAHATRRATELLARFGLTDAGDRPASGYSGGMRRRLDLAASLVNDPDVLFLDEPTTGLDPASRLRLWEVIRELKDDGTTVLLTTQYLEEADALAERIVVIDGGRAIAEGTPDELKSQLGGEYVEVAPRDADRLDEAARLVADLGTGAAAIDSEAGVIRIPAVGDGSTLPAVVRALDGAGIVIKDLGVKRPSLDDVFLELTGERVKADTPATDPTPETGRRSRR